MTASAIRNARVALMLAGLSSWACSLAASAQDNTFDCPQFSADKTYVTFFIDMSLEESEVQLRVPVDYLDDPADHQSGVRRGSQMFHVSVDDFHPARAQTNSSPSQKLQNDTAHFLVGDWRDLEEMAAQVMSSGSQIGGHIDFTDQFLTPAPFGLFRATLMNADGDSRVFVSLEETGALQTLIDCPSSTAGQQGACTQFFRSSGLDVVLNYAAHNLEAWQELQGNVGAFLSCATRY